MPSDGRLGDPEGGSKMEPLCGASPRPLKILVPPTPFKIGGGGALREGKEGGKEGQGVAHRDPPLKTT